MPLGKIFLRVYNSACARKSAQCHNENGFRKHNAQSMHFERWWRLKCYEQTQHSYYHAYNTYYQSIVALIAYARCQEFKYSLHTVLLS
jgi:hypothetical protein